MPRMDKPVDLSEIIVQIARLAMKGRPQDVHAFIRQIIKRIGPEEKALVTQLSQLVAASSSASSPLRDAGTALIPVDSDSRLALLRHEYPVLVDERPVWAPLVEQSIRQVLLERERAADLHAGGVRPTSTLLFEGPPGVGKTLSARWIASRLGRPLLILDLATVVSSYLGKTGANIRAVLDYARKMDCVLLLDEFDAIAKRRDDEADIGELKRLVNVLLQEVDDWPSSGLLIAATNHGELLDRAVWRRFDEIIEFEIPSDDLRRTVIQQEIQGTGAAEQMVGILSRLWEGLSFSDIVRFIDRAKRRAAIHSVPVADALLELVSADLGNASLADRKAASRVLRQLGISERQINALTGLSRDTLRKDRTNEVEADLPGERANG